MNREENLNPKKVKNQINEAKNMNTSQISKKNKNKDLPWWVELLFVQIGLPDKLLIKILKSQKYVKALIKKMKDIGQKFIEVKENKTQVSEQ